ncbi:hypothetical protein K474DRAFT_1699395, partial [Panus rudis PR-1116 ss-1]
MFSESENQFPPPTPQQHTEFMKMNALNAEKYPERPSHQQQSNHEADIAALPDPLPPFIARSSSLVNYFPYPFVAIEVYCDGLLFSATNSSSTITANRAISLRVVLPSRGSSDLLDDGRSFVSATKVSKCWGSVRSVRSATTRAHRTSDIEAYVSSEEPEDDVPVKSTPHPKDVRAPHSKLKGTV